MGYGSELITNGTAEALLAGWTASLTDVQGSSGSRYFLLSASASLLQSFDTIQFSIGQEKKHYLLEALFKYNMNINKLVSEVLAQITITITYSDSTVDIFTVPLHFADHLEVSHNNSIWYQVSEELVIKANSIVTTATLTVEVFSTTTCQLMIDSLSIKRSITDSEAHDNSINPHNLPLAITVGNFGIKAVKDDIVQFWLKDTGAAYFGGTITSDADGVFAGTVFAENIDTINAKISVAQIEQLIVGDNVMMGAGATISWGNVTDAPNVIGTDDVHTILGQNYVITGYLNANLIRAGTIAAQYIETSGLFAERLYDPDHSGNYLELGDASPTSTFMDMKLVHYINGEVFKVRDNVTGAAIYLYGNEILNYNEGVNRTVAFDNWSFVGGVVDFTGATAVLGIDGGEGGSTSFLGLTDTPTDYIGQAGKVVKVNELATALEFTKDKYEQYLYLTNASIDTITTSVKEYILLADLDEDSHIMVHCILTGTSSVDQIITVTSFVKDVEVYEATYQAKSGLNTFVFECPIWSVEEELGVAIDLEVKTSTGTFIIPIGKLVYWINSVGIIGGTQAIYPTIDISDTITAISITIDTVTDSPVIATQIPIAIDVSDTIVAISVTIDTITDSVVLTTETP